MGAWSVSITGNDTAADLRYEYEAAFSRLPPEEAVERLDAYVRRELDGDSWPDYVFSLALFLWKHGLLTAGVRSRALALIDGGRLDVTSMICRTAPLEELTEILSRPELRAKGKYLIAVGKG